MESNLRAIPSLIEFLILHISDPAVVDFLDLDVLSTILERIRSPVGMGGVN
jgi:hypothetical protein